jgi:hypothetical protein
MSEVAAVFEFPGDRVIAISTGQFSEAFEASVGDPRKVIERAVEALSMLSVCVLVTHDGGVVVGSSRESRLRAYADAVARLHKEVQKDSPEVTLP